MIQTLASRPAQARRPQPEGADGARRRSPSVRMLGAVSWAYVALFSAGVVLWLLHCGVAASIWLIGPGVLVPVVAAVLALRNANDARRYAMHVIAAALVLPIVLLFWADSFEAGGDSRTTSAAGMPAGTSSTSGRTLDAGRVFEGASMRQSSEQRSAGMPLLQAAAFADGSELRVTHFASADAAARQIAMLSSALQGVAFDEGGRSGVRLTTAGAPGMLILLERHGADVLELRARSVDIGLARLAAQQVPAPDVRETAPAPSDSVGAGSSGAGWPFFVISGATHLLAFVALIIWAGAATTHVPAAPGVAAVSSEVLARRLGSIARGANKVEADIDADGTLSFVWSANAARTHRITLWLDAASDCVRVGEKLLAQGDRPRSEDEASMRTVGDDAFDATRPDADRVWSSIRQATMIDPARLASVRMQLRDDCVQCPAGYIDSLDAEGLLTLLCAVATRSGWHWQPSLLGR